MTEKNAWLPDRLSGIYRTSMRNGVKKPTSRVILASRPCTSKEPDRSPCIPQCRRSVSQGADTRKNPARVSCNVQPAALAAGSHSHPDNQPRSDAYLTISTRDFAPSFSNARVLYVSTVLTLILRWA